MKKLRSKGVLCEDLDTGLKYVFETLSDAAKAVKASPQSISNSIKRQGLVQKRFAFEMTTRFYVVKTKPGAFKVCVFNEEKNRFDTLGENPEPVLMRSVASWRDVTVCMKNEEVVWGERWFARNRMGEV